MKTDGWHSQTVPATEKQEKQEKKKKEEKQC